MLYVACDDAAVTMFNCSAHDELDALHALRNALWKCCCTSIRTWHPFRRRPVFSPVASSLMVDMACRRSRTSALTRETATTTGSSSTASSRASWCKRCVYLSLSRFFMVQTVRFSFSCHASAPSRLLSSAFMVQKRCVYKYL